MNFWQVIKLWAWKIAHFRQYMPEIRHWFWRMRIHLALWTGHCRGQIPILFYISLRGHSQFILPIIRELRKISSRIDIYLAIDQAGCGPEDRFMGVPRYRFRPLREYLPIRGFKMFITPWQNIPITPPWPLRVCVFHGQPSKGINLQVEGIRRFDVLFLLGPLQRSLYQEFSMHYPETAARLRVFDVGYPKLDALIRGEYSRDNILQSLGLDPANRTVLFAPSFDHGTSLNTFGEEIFKALAELAMAGCNVLVKLHPVTHDPKSRAVHHFGKNWPKILEAYSAGPNFRDAGNTDLTPFLAASEVMVTDVSSAAFDFLLMDRPVVFIDCPQFYARMGDRVYTCCLADPVKDIRGAEVGRNAGLVVADMEEMKKGILRSLANPGEFAEARQKIRDVLLFNPGHAAEVAAQTILALLTEPAS
jgi:hypothetical protein